MNRTRAYLSIIVLALAVIGIVVLASAGSANGFRLYNNPYHFVIRQALWLCMAFFICIGTAFFDYHRWLRIPYLTVAGYIVVLLLLAAVFLFPEIKGSQRWLALGPIRLQPSELAKVFIVIALAVFLDKSGWRVVLFWKGVVPAVILAGIFMGLTVKEPDFGATMVIGAVSLVLFLISGMKLLHIGVIALIGICGGGLMLSLNANRMNRIMAWMPSWLASLCGYSTEDIAGMAARDANHQLNQALVAIRNGGLTGVGFNQSLQKQSYLPEAHTDFIFAIGAEEFGLIFSLVILLLFVGFFICGILISRNAPDRLGRLLAFGMTFLIFFQALFNLGVVSGCLPTKGIALPFISYGGTNLITASIAVGILFNILRQQIELQKPRSRSKITPVFSNQGGC